MSIIKAVECDKCEKLMKSNSEDFLTIMGNICLGLNQGLIGDNLSEDGKVKSNSYFCRSCFASLTKYESIREDNLPTPPIDLSPTPNKNLRASKNEK